MIITLPRAGAPGTYYTQNNNGVEQILVKANAKAKFVSCGPESIANLLACMGILREIKLPGGGILQPGDAMAIWANDPANYDAMLKYRQDTDPKIYLGNTVPQWYEAIVPAVMGVQCRFSWGCNFERIKTAIQAGLGVMLCLKNPGHFIAVVGVDTDKKTVIYNDPWPQNQWPKSMAGKPGEGREVPMVDLESNLQPFMVEVWE